MFLSSVAHHNRLPRNLVLQPPVRLRLGLLVLLGHQGELQGARVIELGRENVELASDGLFVRLVRPARLRASTLALRLSPLIEA